MNASLSTDSPKDFRGPKDYLRLLVLFLFALSVRLLVIGFARFDGLYGQDAFAYLDYTKQILGLHLTGPFYWPLGYPVVAACFAWLLGNPTLGAQWACILMGAALAPLVCALTYELLDGATARLPHLAALAVAAGLLMALSGQVLQSSIVIMSDVPALFWATLSAYALIRLRKSSQWFLLPLAALGLALAIVSRWVYLGLVLPFGFYFFVEHRSLIRSTRFLISLSIFLAILVSQFVFSQSTAAPVLAQSWLVNWDPRNAVQTVFDNSDGHFEYPWPPFIFYAAPFFHPYYLFPLLVVLVLPGIWRLRRSTLLLLLGGWILTLYIYLSGIPYENFRFGLAFFPPVVILITTSLASLPARFMRIAVLIVLLSPLATLPSVVRGMNSLFLLKADELSAAHYLQISLPAHATVVTFSLTLTLDHYTNFKTIELYDQSPSTLNDLTCSSPEPIYLFVQVENIESQWAGRSLQLNFHWLRDQTGLRLIGNQASWTLYEARHGCIGSP
jgi:4-amino-4-deoxy-L-arabinose transferase-like glycosyltransferase